MLDGQGNCNLTRTAAAEALADYLADGPDRQRRPRRPDRRRPQRVPPWSEPIAALRDAGYIDLQERFEGDDAYSYVFDGQLGYLDTALANPTLNGQVTGTTTWHINADEVAAVRLQRRDPRRRRVRRSSGSPTLYALYEPDPIRSSDHDPVARRAVPRRRRSGPSPRLQSDLAGMTIQKGVKNALTSKLATVAAALASGDDAGACAALDEFTVLVTSQRGKKIATADADVLLAGADEVAGARPLLRLLTARSRRAAGPGRRSAVDGVEVVVDGDAADAHRVGDVLDRRGGG